jgi:hypothetical protein
LLTVTAFVAVQPSDVVYVIVVIPSETGVITPPLLIVATDVFDDTQGVEAAGVLDPVRVRVPPTATDEPPVIVGVC